MQSIVSAKPLYKIDPETGEPITKYDPLSNTYVKVPDEENIAYFELVNDRQDQLQADYVGLTLEQWREIDDLPNPSEVKANRINAVKIGITYEEYLDFSTLNPTDPEAWTIYPFSDYDSENELFVGDFALNNSNIELATRFANPTKALENLLSQNANSGISRTDLANLMFSGPIYEPTSVSTDDSSQIKRADTVIYSSTSPDSALYIAPMDSVYQDGSTLKSYRTNNPSPYKFQIDNFEDADLLTEGTQTRYVVNYTYGDFAVS